MGKPLLGRCSTYFLTTIVKARKLYHINQISAQSYSATLTLYRPLRNVTSMTAALRNDRGVFHLCVYHDVSLKRSNFSTDKWPESSRESRRNRFFFFLWVTLKHQEEADSVSLSEIWDNSGVVESLDWTHKRSSHFLHLTVDPCRLCLMSQQYEQQALAPLMGKW